MKKQMSSLLIPGLLLSLICTALGAGGTAALHREESGTFENPAAAPKDSVIITSLPEAERLAFQSNADMVNGRVDIKVMAERRRAALSDLLPQVTAGGSATDNTNIPTTIIPGGLLPGYPNQTAIALGVQYGANGNVQARQKLFDASSIIGLRAAHASEQLAALTLESTREEVAMQVATVYYNLQLSSEQIAFLKKQVESYQSLSAIAEVQFQAGVAKKSDNDRIRVNQTNIETELDQIENLYSGQLTGLALLLGLPPEKKLVVRDDLNLNAAPGGNEGAFDVRLRPDWQVLEKQAALQELDISLKKAQWFPVLAANANYNQDFYGPEFDPQTRSNWYPSSSVSLTLDIPIFDGFKRNAELGRSRLELEKTRNMQAHLRATIGKEIQDARSTLAYSKARLAGQKANQDLAGEVYDETVVEYKSGTATLSDLQNAENALIESQAQYMAALADQLLAELSLHKAQGTLLGSLGTE
jgi:outer membrane protein TolC